MKDEMEVGEKVETTDHIVICPHCGKETGYNNWKLTYETAMCPNCGVESPYNRLKLRPWKMS